MLSGLTCPEPVGLRSLRDVLPAVQRSLVTEGLEVLHDLAHVLSKHKLLAKWIPPWYGSIVVMCYVMHYLIWEIHSRIQGSGPKYWRVNCW